MLPRLPLSPKRKSSQPHSRHFSEFNRTLLQQAQFAQKTYCGSLATLQRESLSHFLSGTKRRRTEVDPAESCCGWS